MAIKLNGSTSGSVALDAPADTSPSGTDVTLTLPTSAGSSGQYLQTNGTGTLSWQTVTSTEYQGPSFYAELSSNQTLSSSTWTKLTYQSEIFDTDSDYDNSTNYRFTPSKAGKYAFHVRGSFDYTGTAPTVVGLRLYKNGVQVAYQIQIGVGGYGGTLSLDHIEDMNGSTDYMEVFGYFNQANCYFGYSGNINAFMGTWVHD